MINQDSIQKTYTKYARLYDFTFGVIINPGRKKVIEKLECKKENRILEVGVGTGLSLPLYPKDSHIVGIDMADEMLDIAKERIVENGIKNVVLQKMNAEEMTFEDNTFDKVIALYVASVVPNPEKLISEMSRVCKPNGEMYIVNHFCSDHFFIKFCENLISPFLTKIFGYQPGVKLSDLVNKTGIDIIEKAPVNFLGNWTFLKVRNHKYKVFDNEDKKSVKSINCLNEIA